MEDTIESQEKYYTITYSFTDGGEELLGSSETSGPYTFCFGSGDCIPGLEPRIADMQEGESRSFVIPAAEGYGTYNPDLARTIARSSLPESLQLQEGLQLTINNTLVTVVSVDGDMVTVDGNHPLAGVDLHFSVRIEAISFEPPRGYGESCGCNSSCGCGGH